MASIMNESRQCREIAEWYADKAARARRRGDQEQAEYFYECAREYLRKFDYAAYQETGEAPR